MTRDGAIPDARELDNIVVKRLLERIAEKDKQIETLNLWVVVLAVICLALLMSIAR